MAVGCSSKDLGSFCFVCKDVGYSRQMSFLYLLEVDNYVLLRLLIM